MLMQATSIRVDLTAANSVHLIEPQWNPMVEAQAVDRVHRIGQQRDVRVYRYIVSDSIESVRIHSGHLRFGLDPATNTISVCSMGSDR